MTSTLADGSAEIVTMAIGKKAMTDSLKGKLGWMVALGTACVELCGLYRRYLRHEGGENFKMTYVKKGGAIIAA